MSAVLALALAPSAFAADLDDNILRGPAPVGPPPVARWSGFYVGGQAGYSSSMINFGTAASGDISFILRNTAIEQNQQISQWTVLGQRFPTSASFGGFVGYNVQFEDTIVGFEVNYNHLNLSSTSSDSLARSFTDSTNLPSGHHYLYNVNLTGSGSVSLSDVATFRARGGWVAGNFLPYGFVGAAIGRANLNNSATLSFTATDYPDSLIPPLTPLNPINFGPVTQSNGQNGAIAYGVTAGVGLDYALTQNIFVRGEYEYIYFAPIDGTQISLQSVRAGAGLKF
jgi:opacity protein-like surface antigen